MLISILKALIKKFKIKTYLMKNSIKYMNNLKFLIFVFKIIMGNAKLSTIIIIINKKTGTTVLSVCFFIFYSDT